MTISDGSENRPLPTKSSLRAARSQKEENLRARKLIIVAVLAIATVAGLVALVDFWEKQSAEEKLAQSVKSSEYTYQQCRDGDYATSKEAILAHLELLNQRNAESERPGRNPYFVDGMMWYVRLARLEETNNNPAGRSNAMTEALSRCAKTGRWDCSEETLVHEVERMARMASR